MYTVKTDHTQFIGHLYQLLRMRLKVSNQLVKKSTGRLDSLAYINSKVDRDAKKYPTILCFVVAKNMP